MNTNEMENREIFKNNATTVNKMIAKSTKRKKSIVKRSTLSTKSNITQEL